jgi:hypothetical protein
VHAVIRVSWSNGKGGGGKHDKAALVENFNWDKVMEAIREQLPDTGVEISIDGWKWNGD